MTKYLELLRRLNTVNKFRDKKVSLEHMKKTLALLGDPHKNMKCIHVAGTNGKGSVSLKISKALEVNKIRTGLFTSPHLFYYGERVQINGNYWEEDFVEDCLTRLFALTSNHKIDLTFFEYLTALMFEYYKQKQVEVAVIECGLGGRLDSTNVIENPLVSVITSIGLDHTEILGETLKEIATEKAGIIKPNRPVVIGPNSTPVDVFQERCNLLQSKLSIVKQTQRQIADYNIENSDIAQEAIQVIKNTYSSDFGFLDNQLVSQGIKSEQKCRMEVLELSIASKFPCAKVIFDVGHNPAALEKVLLRIRIHNPYLKIRVIYGTSSLKDAAESLNVLALNCRKIHIVEASHFRAMKINSLEQSRLKLKSFIQNYEELMEPIVQNGNIRETLNDALNKCSQNEIILICGSFFIQSEARTYFGILDKKDSDILSQRD